jgi:hypothetical protein
MLADTPRCRQAFIAFTPFRHIFSWLPDYAATLALADFRQLFSRRFSFIAAIGHYWLRFHSRSFLSLHVPFLRHQLLSLRY